MSVFVAEITCDRCPSDTGRKSKHARSVGAARRLAGAPPYLDRGLRFVSSVAPRQTSLLGILCLSRVRLRLQLQLHRRWQVPHIPWSPYSTHTRCIARVFHYSVLLSHAKRCHRQERPRLCISLPFHGGAWLCLFLHFNLPFLFHAIPLSLSLSLFLCATLSLFAYFFSLVPRRSSPPSSVDK